MAHIFKNIGVAGVLAGSLALGGGCGTMSTGGTQTWSLKPSEEASAAVGKVKVANEKDGNTKVKVEVSYLAPPASTADEGAFYVVWIQPTKGDPQNAGILQLDKKRKGELKTMTPFKSFTVKVTLEPRPGVTAPTGKTLLDQHIVMPS